MEMRNRINFKKVGGLCLDILMWAGLIAGVHFFGFTFISVCLAVGFALVVINGILCRDDVSLRRNESGPWA